MPAGDIHFRLRAVGRQGRPPRAAADLRLGDGHLSGLPRVLLLHAGTRRGDVHVRAGAAHQPRCVHQHVLARFRPHSRRDDGRAVQPGRQGPGARHRVRDRVPARVRCRQDVPEPVGLVRLRHHVLDIRRVLRAGHRVCVVPGAGDQEQVPAGDPERAERQEEAQEPQHQPLSTEHGIADRTVQPEERRDRLKRPARVRVDATCTFNNYKKYITRCVCTTIYIVRACSLTRTTGHGVLKTIYIFYPPILNRNR